MDRVPPLSVGLTVYNGENYLAQALDSVLAQTFADFELIISDNCSTDRTAEICQAYAARDSRIRYSRIGMNVGAGPNFNRVVKLARAPLFKWMAHDDALEPDFLAACMDIMTQDPDCVLVHSAIKLIDDDGHPIIINPRGHIIDGHGNRHHDLEPLHLCEGAEPTRRFGEALRRMNWCTALFGIIRKDALLRTHLLGGYYEADRILLAELALLGHFRQIDRPLFVKRCHAGVSVLMDDNGKAGMMDPNRPPGLPGLQVRRGYARALKVGQLSPRERAACALIALRTALRNPLAYRVKRWLHATLDNGFQALP